MNLTHKWQYLRLNCRNLRAAFDLVILLKTGLSNSPESSHIDQATLSNLRGSIAPETSDLEVRRELSDRAVLVLWCGDEKLRAKLQISGHQLQSLRLLHHDGPASSA